MSPSAPLQDYWSDYALRCSRFGEFGRMVTQATYFSWKKRYGGLMPSEMRRLKELEDENTRLKRIVAYLSLDKEMLQDVLKRKLWGLVASGSSSRRRFRNRACRSGEPVAIFCSTRPPSTIALGDPIRPRPQERIKDICGAPSGATGPSRIANRVRYGYRRVHVMLRREDLFVNQSVEGPWPKAA